MKFYSLSRHLKSALLVLLIVANVQLAHAQFVIHPKSSAAQVTQKDARQFIFDADSARWTFAGRDVAELDSVTGYQDVTRTLRSETVYRDDVYKLETDSLPTRIYSIRNGRIYFAPVSQGGTRRYHIRALGKNGRATRGNQAPSYGVGEVVDLKVGNKLLIPCAPVWDAEDEILFANQAKLSAEDSVRMFGKTVVVRDIKYDKQGQLQEIAYEDVTTKEIFENLSVEGELRKPLKDLIFNGNREHEFTLEWKGLSQKYKIALNFDESESTIKASITGRPYEKVANASKVKGSSKGEILAKEKDSSKDKDASKDDKGEEDDKKTGSLSWTIAVKLALDDDPDNNAFLYRIEKDSSGDMVFSSSTFDVATKLTVEAEAGSKGSLSTKDWGEMGKKLHEGLSLTDIPVYAIPIAGGDLKLGLYVPIVLYASAEASLSGKATLLELNTKLGRKMSWDRENLSFDYKERATEFDYKILPKLSGKVKGNLSAGVGIGPAIKIGDAEARLLIALKGETEMELSGSWENSEELYGTFKPEVELSFKLWTSLEYLVKGGKLLEWEFSGDLSNRFYFVNEESKKPKPKQTHALPDKDLLFFDKGPIAHAEYLVTLKDEQYWAFDYDKEKLKVDIRLADIKAPEGFKTFKLIVKGRYLRDEVLPLTIETREVATRNVVETHKMLITMQQPHVLRDLAKKMVVADQVSLPQKQQRVFYLSDYLPFKRQLFAMPERYVLSVDNAHVSAKLIEPDVSPFDLRYLQTPEHGYRLELTADNEFVGTAQLLIVDRYSKARSTFRLLSNAFDQNKGTIDDVFGGTLDGRHEGRIHETVQGEELNGKVKKDSEVGDVAGQPLDGGVKKDPEVGDVGGTEI